MRIRIRIDATVEVNNPLQELALRQALPLDSSDKEYLAALMSAVSRGIDAGIETTRVTKTHVEVEEVVDA